MNKLFNIFQKDKFDLHRLTLAYFSFFIIFAIALDQVTKFLVRNNFNLHESLEIIPNFFYFTFHINTGAAFSFLSNQSYGLSFLTLISWVSAVAMSIFFVKELLKEEKTFKELDKIRQLFFVALAFLLAGCVGNGIDRLFLEGVTDMLDFRFRSYHFAVFNVADIFVCLGAFLLVVALFFEERKVQ